MRPLRPRSCSSGLLSEPLAGFDIELPGGESGDLLHTHQPFWNPQRWHAMLQERVAQLNEFLLYGLTGRGGQQHESLPLVGIGHADDRDAALRLAVQSEGAIDVLLDGFMRHHFPADLGETAETSFDVKESIGIHPS